MTIIAGVECEDGVVLGADAACTTRSALAFTPLAYAKVWADREWTIGVCGSLRLSQLLRYDLSLPQVPETDDDDEFDNFMVVTFMDLVRGCILESGVVESRHSVENIEEGDFLVGARNRLYLVQNDFSVVRSLYGYHATGCAYDVALGALHATDGLDAHTRVQAALEASAAHSAGVAPPFTIVENRISD